MPDPRRLVPYALLLALSVALGLAWWWPNRPVAGDVQMPVARFNSVSFAPYRKHESPLTRRFPTRAEVDQDLGLIAARSRAIRTYAALEGDYDLPAMARAHGLKMWQGIWLGADRAANAREIAAGIAAANAYPDVIERVVVGNEVLLRRDLPADELIGYIDQVKRAVKQRVTYADVWNFFVDNPQVVPHLDVVTIHILPYWEDDPTNIAGAMAHARDVVARMHAAFPGRELAIGETGWPSRGRWRRDAAPSLVNQVVFMREFIAFAASQGLDYNYFQSFDQDWKFRDEGVMGASWGLWTAARIPKYPLHGPVQEDAAWPVPAALSIVCAWLLFAGATLDGAVRMRRRLWVALAAALVGGALGFAWAGTAPVLFDRFVLVAGIGNLAGQTVLGWLFVRHLAGGAPEAARTGRDATEAARSLLRLRWPAAWRGPEREAAILDDLLFVFVWTAGVLQLLLVYDPRYREFPLPCFAVPVVVTALRVALRAWPRGGGGREEWVAGLVLLLGALAGGWQEGARNLQSIGWTMCAVLLALPVLARGVRSQAHRPSAAPSMPQLTL